MVTVMTEASRKEGEGAVMNVIIKMLQGVAWGEVGGNQLWGSRGS